MQKSSNALERLTYYRAGLPRNGKVIREPCRHVEGAVPADWPRQGEIVLDNVSLRYRPELPLSLKHISLHIRSGERFGIVGRTGAGKSSLLAALLRVDEVEPGGQIRIDGIDISKIGLHDLRQQMSIIMQDPIFFEGTVRNNLDPSGKINDVTLTLALREAWLLRDESTLGLDSHIEQAGGNFSQGQRQLLSLARAIVRRSRIVLVDEATASVDDVTDAQIQQSLRQSFAGCTVLTIAHRIRTVLEYDRICVLDGGQVVELGTPRELWARPSGRFRQLCDESGVVVVE